MNQCYLGQEVKFNNNLVCIFSDPVTHEEDAISAFVDTNKVYTIIDAVAIRVQPPLSPLGMGNTVSNCLFVKQQDVFVRLEGLATIESIHSNTHSWVNILDLEPVQDEQTNGLLEAPNLE